MTREHMVDDQRFASRRKDVLAFQTEPLEADVTLAGPIAASLMVSTSGTDSDWIVKVIDVYPDVVPAASEPGDPTGLAQPERPRMALYQQLVRAEPMRGKFRNGFEKPEPFAPGTVTKVDWTMPDVCHTFLKGHRIMVQVQSTWFPLVNLNPQTFVNINTARESDFRKAVQRVYHAPDRASKVTVSLAFD
jgi:putative CocE/NonD family hydrolase